MPLIRLVFLFSTVENEFIISPFGVFADFSPFFFCLGELLEESGGGASVHLGLVMFCVCMFI